MDSSGPVSNAKAERVCATCGARLYPDDRFCGACGAPVVDEVELPQPAAEPSQIRVSPAPPDPGLHHRSSASGGSLSNWRVLPEVLGIWIAGWLAGGLGGIFIFAEVLHRTAFVSGATLPGVMLGPLVGEPPVRMIEGFNLADASLWAVFGLAGGVVAAIAPLLMRRKVRPVGFGFGSVLVLIWSALIAVLVNISFFALVPIVGALTGALYAVWALAGTDGPSPNHQAKRDWRGIGWISLIWFLASIAASILILIVQNI